MLFMFDAQTDWDMHRSLIYPLLGQLCNSLHIYPQACNWSSGHCRTADNCGNYTTKYHLKTKRPCCTSSRCAQSRGLEIFGLHVANHRKPGGNSGNGTDDKIYITQLSHRNVCGKTKNCL